MGRKTDRRRSRAQSPAAKPQKRIATPYLSRFDGLLEQHALAVFFVVVVAAKLVVFRQYMLLKNVFLFKDIGSDSINSTYPTLYHVIEYLKTDGLPRWTFYQGMGQNLLGPLVFDPFLAVFYLVGPDHLAYAIGYVELIKEILGGLFFFLFLRQRQSGGFASIVGGLLYAFTGYVVLGGGWYIFSYDALCIALLLYAYEKFHTEQVWYLLPVPLALMAAYQPFFLYIYALLLLVYAAVRRFDERQWSSRWAITSLATLGASGLLALALTAVFFLGNVSQILASPRVGGQASLFHLLLSQRLFAFATPVLSVTEVLRLFSSDLMGTGNAYRGWGNYLEAPLLYAGLVTLLLVPQAIVLADRRRKIVYLALLASCAVPFVFPYFRYAFWLFAGDYFRTLSFLVAVLLVYLSVRALGFQSTDRRISIPTLAFSLLGALLVLYFPSPLYDRYTAVDEGIRTTATAFLLLDAVLILALRAPRFVVIARFSILASVAIEGVYLANITVNKRDVLSTAELSQRTGYNDYTRDAIRHLDSLDASFYRVSKDYASGPAMHASLNDGMVQHYRGTTSYHPFNEKGYIDFLQAFDVIHPGNELETRWAPGTANRIALEAITSVKYALTKRPGPDAFGVTYEHLADFQDVHLYRNRYSLPFGFCYGTYIPASIAAPQPPDVKDQIVVKAAVVDEDVAKQLVGLQTLQLSALAHPYTVGGYDADIRARRSDTLTVTEHAQNRIRGTIRLAHRRLMFLSIPYDRGWKALVDGKEAPLLKVNAGFMGLVLEPGEHTILLEFKPPYLVAGTGVSLFSVLAYAVLLIRPRIRRGAKEQA